jgi:hypothetical protein
MAPISGEKSEIHGKKSKINVMFWRMKKRLLKMSNINFIPICRRSHFREIRRLRFGS